MSEEVTSEEQWLYGENQDSLVSDEVNVDKEIAESTNVKESEKSVSAIEVDVAAGTPDAVSEGLPPGTDSLTPSLPVQLSVSIEDDLRPPGVDDDLANDLIGRQGNVPNGKGKRGNGEGDYGDASGDGDDDDDDDDDDDLNIVIGTVNTEEAAAEEAAAAAAAGAGTETTTSTTVFDGLNIKRGQLPPIVNAAEKLKQVSGKFTVEDFEGAGVINNIPVADYSLDAVEDKPWRKPGADISDYFNYGFNEETWNAYCERQKRIRSQVGVGPAIGLPMLGNMPGHGLCIPNDPSKFPPGALLPPVSGAGPLRKMLPPLLRRPTGSIDVIGGSTMTSRRPDSLNGPPPGQGNLGMIDVLGNEKADFVPPIIPGAFPPFDNDFFNPEPTPYYDGFEPTQDVQWKPGQEPNWPNLNAHGRDNGSGKIQVLSSSNVVALGQQQNRLGGHGRSMSKRYDDLSLNIKREPHYYRSKSRSRSPYRDNDRSVRSDRSERSDRHKDRHRRDRSRSRTHRHRSSRSRSGSRTHRHRSSRSRSGSRHRSSHKKKKSRHHDKEDSS